MEFWELILLTPILNFLILLSNVLFHNFGLAIIVLTLLVRLVMLPLTLKQLRSSRAMSEGMKAVQPKLQLLKKKYAKDPRKLQQEQMKLYKEAGISPLGCLSSPMLLSTAIQIPIFIALYRAIIQALAVTPQDFLGLSESLYSWPIVREALPVSGHFLWMNLGTPDPYFIIPLFVMATMWLSQKMITQPAADQQQQSMQNMMQLMMPLMFGFITFTLPAGLGLYFVMTSVFSIVVQYFVYGWGNLSDYRNIFRRTPPTQAPDKKGYRPDKHGADITATGQPAAGKRRGLRDIGQALSPFEKKPNPEEGPTHGKSRSKR